MAFMKKRSVQIVLTLLFSALALYVALRGVDFQQVGAALGQVRWGWLIVTLLLIWGTLLIRAERWRILLSRELSLGDALGLTVIGYLVSGVLPMRAGDPARAVGASLRGPVSAIAALSTVVVERVLDMALIVLILLITLPFVPGLRAYLRTGMVSETLSVNLVLALSGGLAFGLLVVFVLVALHPEQVEALARRLLERLRIPNPERWLRPIQNVLDGLKVLGSPRAGWEVLGWSAALWLTTATYFYTGMLACRAFIPDPSLLKGAVATWASAFGMVFPATGGIGSFHFAVREALAWGFEIPRDLGFAYAVIVHALPYLSGIGLGTATLLLWGISLRRLVATEQTPELE